MQVDERTWFSPSLGQDMTLKVYGHDGRPDRRVPVAGRAVLGLRGLGHGRRVSPASSMPGGCGSSPSTAIDWQSWTNQSIAPADRGRRHDAYDRYLADEVVPFVRELTGWERAWATGASMGGYHAANVLFRHPDLFDGLVAMSGLYQLGLFVGDDASEARVLQQPAALPAEPRRPVVPRPAPRGAARVRRRPGRVRGRRCSRTPARCGDVLAAKGIPAIVDEWGDDVNHDWPWWRKMLPHYLERLGV